MISLFSEATISGMTFIFPIKFFPLNAQLQDGPSSCSEFFTKGCSSKLAADGLSAGFILRQRLKNSLPTGDNVSGIGGVIPLPNL